MRAPVKGEKLPAILVSLARIEQVDAIVRRDEGWTIGPMVAHETLAPHLEAAGSFRALAEATGKSANPGVRRLATIGGNIAAADFEVADLPPALLAHDASVTVTGEVLPVFGSPRAGTSGVSGSGDGSRR